MNKKLAVISVLNGIVAGLLFPYPCWENPYWYMYMFASSIIIGIWL